MESPLESPLESATESPLESPLESALEVPLVMGEPEKAVPPLAPAVLPSEHFLHDVWCLFFHDPYDSNWEKTGYHKLCVISTIEDFGSCHTVLDEMWSRGMFFLMREHVFPLWSDDENKDGGVLSIKILKSDLKSFWLQICARLLGETLVRPEHAEKKYEVNGISVSPKKHFCIIKIWLRSELIQDASWFLLPEYHGETIYKTHASHLS